jgi:hypothetical protein
MPDDGTSNGGMTPGVQIGIATGSFSVWSSPARTKVGQALDNCGITSDAESDSTSSGSHAMTGDHVDLVSSP